MTPAIWHYHDLVTTNIVWYTAYTREVGGSRVLRNSRALVFQQGVQCRWAGEMKGGSIRAHIPCPGQPILHVSYASLYIYVCVCTYIHVCIYEYI